MCGFVGFLSSGERPPLDLAAWGTAIEHRGPDQAGASTRGPFGVATRRLSILDLSSAGDQPMETARFVVAFNGEIYNHLSLRRTLSAEGNTTFQSRSDTETILRGLEHWGVDGTLERLNGMYALAIWDHREQCLVLARDPLGVKPLYYLQRNGLLYFGSELKALAPFTDGHVSIDGLALYLSFGFVPAPYSLVAGLEKLRPGEVVRFDGRKRRSAFVTPRAWDFPFERAEHAGERAEQVRACVESAIERQLLSDVPTGIFLSGGVDSSIIATVVAERASNVTSFSIRPIDGTLEGSGADAAGAARLAERLGFQHHEVLIDPLGFMQGGAEALRWWDEPVVEPYFWAEVQLSRASRAAGVPVVLTGHGADEVFLGYQSYRAMRKGEAYDRVPLLGVALRLATKFPGLDRAVRNNLEGAASVWRQPFLQRYSTFTATLFDAHSVAKMLGVAPEHVEHLVASVCSQTLQSVDRMPRPVTHPLRAADLAARMDLMLRVPEHYNMRLDRATMSASVEARVPFQDLELLNVALRMPSQDHLDGGLKGLLKRAFAARLSRDMVRGRKRTFQAPVAAWLSGALRPWVQQNIDDLGRVLDLSERTVLPNAPTARDAYPLWSLALFEAWRHAFKMEVPRSGPS